MQAGLAGTGKGADCPRPLRTALPRPARLPTSRPHLRSENKRDSEHNWAVTMKCETQKNSEALDTQAEKQKMNRRPTSLPAEDGRGTYWYEPGEIGQSPTTCVDGAAWMKVARGKGQQVADRVPPTCTKGSGDRLRAADVHQGEGGSHAHRRRRGAPAPAAGSDSTGTTLVAGEDTPTAPCATRAEWCTLARGKRGWKTNKFIEQTTCNKVQSNDSAFHWQSNTEWLHVPRVHNHICGPTAPASSAA